MLTTTGVDIIANDPHRHKFGCEMAEYLFDHLLSGFEGQDSASDGDGEWFERYGKRILFGDNRGFVNVVKFATIEDAIEAFRLKRDELEPSEHDDEPHVGHFSRLGGTWWCDTCNSPYCDQA